MAVKKVTISIDSNNSKIVDLFVGVNNQDDFCFKRRTPQSQEKYLVYVIDLNSDLIKLSQELSDAVRSASSIGTKISVCLLFSQKIDTEKVKYIQTLLDALDKADSVCRLCLAKDLYQDILPYPITYFDKIIWDSFEKLSWSTSTKGENYFYPLYIGDFVQILAKTLFLNNTSGKTYWIFGDKISDLDLGYLLKKALADGRKDFQIESVLANYQEDSQYLNLGNETQIRLSWRPDTDFEQKLKNNLSIYNRTAHLDTEVSKQEKSSNTTNRIISLKNKILNLNYKHHTTRAKNRFLVFSLKLLTLIVSLYLLSGAVFAWSLFQEYSSISKSLDLASTGDLESSVKEVNNLRFYNNLSKFSIEPIKSLVIVVSPHTGEELVNLFAFTNYLSVSLENLQQTYVLADTIYKGLFDSQSPSNIEDSILALRSNLSLVYENLQQIRLSIDSKKLPNRVVREMQKSDKYTRLGQIEKQVSYAMKIAEIMPKVMRSDKTVNIGIMVQDSDEIRPTGGLLKTLIVLTFNGGKFSESRSFTPENIDSISSGAAQAPEMISRITGKNDFLFKDMNYSADYSQTSEYIIWFLGRTINLQIDSLVAFNKSLFQKMLTESGPVEIDGKVYKSSDLHSVSSSINSSKEITEYFLKRITHSELPLATLGRSVISEIEAGNIYIYSSDKEAQSAISRLPLSGIVQETPCLSGLSEDSDCISQTTYLNEANFTSAPLNHSLHKTQTHSITLSSQSFNHEYKIDYSFAADFSNIEKDYQLVYQLFAPSGTELLALEVDGSTVSSNGSFIKLKHGNFEYFQIPISFSPVGDHKVVIKFDTPLLADFNPAKTSVSFTEIKQSGSSDKGTLLMIKTPENTKPLAISQEIQTSQGYIAVQLPSQTASFGMKLGY